jgi:hypothetical protein
MDDFPSTSFILLLERGTKGRRGTRLLVLLVNRDKRWF